MQDFKNTELPDLFDLLALQTNRYMKMLSDGATKNEFNLCRETIIDIQTEIQSRKIQKNNVSSTSSDISFTRNHTG
jgi:hypothetical protein